MARTIALNLLFKTMGTDKIKAAEKDIGGFRKTLGGLGGAIAGFAGAGVLADFAKDSIKAASDLSESMSKVNVVFGDSAKEIVKFADNSATAFGQSKQQALEAAGTFGNLFVSMKIGQQESAGMSTSLVRLASDLASFNNASPTEALDALRSGLVGETEPLRRFGINLNDASLKAEALALGLEFTGNTLPPATKAQAAYSLILKQSTTAQGDFARTSTGLANQQRIMTAQFEDAKAALGEKLMPVALKFFGFLNSTAIPALRNAIEWIDKNSSALGTLAKIVGGGVAVWLTYSAAVKASAAAHAIFAAGSKVISTVSSAWETLRIRAMMMGDAISNAGGPIKAFSAQVGGMAGVVSKMKSGLSSAIGFLGGPWGIAVMGAVAALGYFATRNDESEARVKSLTDALVENKGAFDDQTVASIRSRLESEGLLKIAERLGINLQTFTSAVMGNKGAIDSVNASLAVYTNRVKASNTAGDSAVQGAGGYTHSVSLLKEAISSSNSEIGESVAAYKRIQAATPSTVQGQKDVSGGFYKIQGAASAAEKEIKDVTQALGIFDAKALDARLATLDFRDDVMAFTKSVKENGLAIDKTSGKFRSNTEAGRNNERMLINLVKKAGEASQKEYELTGSTKKANDKFREQISWLIKSASKHGVNKAALQRLIDAYVKLPKTVNAAIGSIKDRKVRIEVRAGGELIGYKVSGGTLLKADGGVLPGYTPGRDVHMFTSPTGGALGLSGGEAVMRPEWTKAVGPGFVDYMNKVAKRGGAPAVKRALGRAGVPGEGAFYANGGIIPTGGAYGAGSVQKMAAKANGLYGKWAGNIGTGLSKKFSDMLGVGGPKVQKALAWAKKQNGKPYVWGGSGPGGYDCSGFMGSIAAIIKGKNPYSRYFTTYSFGSSSGPMGFKRDKKSGFTVGVTDAGVGHMAGTLGKTNVESSGSRGVHLGKSARGTNNSLFSRRYGMTMARGGIIPHSGTFDRGGTLPRGYSTVFNGTGGKESLRPTTSSGGTGGSGDMHIQTVNVYGVHDVPTLVKQIQAYAKDRGGIVLKVRTH